MLQESPGFSDLGSSMGAACDWKRSSPPLAVSIWANMLSSVVLPEPDGPMMVRNSPSFTLKLRSLMTHDEGSRPRRSAKRLLSPRTSSTGSAAIVSPLPAYLGQAGDASAAAGGRPR